MEILTAAKNLLLKHEGLRLKPYKDTVGKLTIGVGRNLDDVGITEAEALHLLANDIMRTQRDLSTAMPWFNALDDVRKLALLDMAFNLGVPGLLKFRNMLKAIQDKRWTLAAEHAKNSLWAQQVGKHADEICSMLITGEMQ